MQAKENNPHLKRTFSFTTDYGNLVEHHMLNAINYGAFNYSGEVFDVLILNKAGRTIRQEEKRQRKTEKLWKWPCRTAGKIMTHVVKTTKY